jgi:hypothetical protein
LYGKTDRSIDYQTHKRVHARRISSLQIVALKMLQAAQGITWLIFCLPGCLLLIMCPFLHSPINNQFNPEFAIPPEIFVRQQKYSAFFPPKSRAFKCLPLQMATQEP